jgi:NADPH:quinone reductase-like Zn-dependent oxidoreductase
MKAIVYTEYGNHEVLKIKEVEKPRPTANELLIKVDCTSINFGDSLARAFKNISHQAFNMPLLFWLLAKLNFGINKPRINILGNSFSGTIEATGSKVKRYKAGEAVFGYTGEKMGAYAEYLCMPEMGMIAPKPVNISHAAASTLPYSSLMALSLLKKTKIQRNQKVLIVGASGGIGSALVQLAKYKYSAEVTAVCSIERLEFVKKLGADYTFDYQHINQIRNQQIYDLIIDVLGKLAYGRVKNSLNDHGMYLSVSFKAAKLLQMIWSSLSSNKKAMCALAFPKATDLLEIKQLVEEGKIKTIIDKRFPLEQTSDAHKYYETGLRKGNVVINTNSGSASN